MPKINFLRQKLWPVERAQTNRQTDRDSKYRTTYRFFLVIFFSCFFFIDERSNINIHVNLKLPIRQHIFKKINIINNKPVELIWTALRKVTNEIGSCSVNALTSYNFLLLLLSGLSQLRQVSFLKRELSLY